MQLVFADPNGDPAYTVVVQPSSAPAGSTFRIRVDLTPGEQEGVVPLDLYRLTRTTVEGTRGTPIVRTTKSYMTGLGEVRAGKGGGTFALATQVGDPVGSYCVAARVPRSSCGELVVS